jgi:hypothetical protein
MNRAEAAEFLAVSPRQIRNLVGQGLLETVGQGTNKRITTASLRRYKGESEES